MAMLLDLTLTAGAKVTVNLDMVTYMQPSGHGTVIWFAGDNIIVQETLEIVRSRWLAQRQS